MGHLGIMLGVWPEWAQTGLLAAGFAVGALALIGLTVWRPAWGVALGAMVNYNPLFNYHFLFTREFQGGATRATLSLSVLGCLYLGLAINRWRQKLPLLWRFRLPWQLTYVILVLIGAGVGLASGHDLRLVGSDLFPVAEFVAYFPLVGLACRDRQAIIGLVFSMLLWGGLVAAIEAGLYVVWGDRFISRFALAGTSTLVHRLDDFMPALLLPLGVAIATHADRLAVKGLAILASVMLATATALSFFRSLWLGLFVAMTVIVVIVFTTPSVSNAIRRYAVTAAATAVVITAVTLVVVNYLRVLPGVSTLSLILSRISHIENTSGSARVDDNRQLISMLEAHPFGVGLGGMESHLPLFSTSDYYLSAAAELGVAGLVLLTVMGVVFLRLNYRRYRLSSDPMVRAVILGTIGSYVCMGVTLLTFPSLLHYPIPAYLGLLGGAMGVLARSSNQDDPVQKGLGQSTLLRGRTSGIADRVVNSVRRFGVTVADPFLEDLSATR